VGNDGGNCARNVFDLCEGTIVYLQVSTFVSSHSPEFWTKPEEFNPNRFEDEELLKRCERTND